MGCLHARSRSTGSSVDGVPRYRLDLAYPRAKIAIEYDGEEHHSSAADRRRDEERRAWLRSHGWRVLVLTKNSFSDEAERRWLGLVSDWLGR